MTRLATRVAGPVLLGCLAGSLVAGRLETAWSCLLLATIAAVIAGAGWPRARWFAGLAVAAVTAVGLNAVLVGGEPLVPRWGVLPPLSREGVYLGVLLFSRLAGALVALYGLAAAWPGERAADELLGRVRSLERVGVPLRAVRAVTGLALRFAPLVGAEARRIVRLQDLRAGRPPRGRREWLERRRAALVPIVVCGLERAERVALGMEARHYRLRPIPPPQRAWVAELGGLVVAGASLLWRP